MGEKRQRSKKHSRTLLSEGLRDTANVRANRGRTAQDSDRSWCNQCCARKPTAKSIMSTEQCSTHNCYHSRKSVFLIYLVCCRLLCEHIGAATLLLGVATSDAVGVTLLWMGQHGQLHHLFSRTSRGWLLHELSLPWSELPTNDAVIEEGSLIRGCLCGLASAFGAVFGSRLTRRNAARIAMVILASFCALTSVAAFGITVILIATGHPLSTRSIALRVTSTVFGASETILIMMVHRLSQRRVLRADSFCNRSCKCLHCRISGGTGRRGGQHVASTDGQRGSVGSWQQPAKIVRKKHGHVPKDRVKHKRHRQHGKPVSHTATAADADAQATTDEDYVEDAGAESSLLDVWRAGCLSLGPMQFHSFVGACHAIRLLSLRQKQNGCSSTSDAAAKQAANSLLADCLAAVSSEQRDQVTAEMAEIIRTFPPLPSSLSCLSDVGSEATAGASRAASDEDLMRAVRKSMAIVKDASDATEVLNCLREYRSTAVQAFSMAV